MGQIISIEQLKIEREQKIRADALKHFPWEEMDLIQLYILKPLSEEWSNQRQILVLEATYRLVFDAYFWGLKAKKKQKGAKKSSIAYDPSFEQRIEGLIEQVMDDFLIQHYFSSQKQASIQTIFHSLAQEWFLRGLIREKAKE